MAWPVFLTPCLSVQSQTVSRATLLFGLLSEACTIPYRSFQVHRAILASMNENSKSSSSVTLATFSARQPCVATGCHIG